MARFILVAFLFAAQALAISPKTRNQVTLTVGLFDYAGFGAGRDAMVEQQVSHIYNEAGIAIRWETFVVGPHSGGSYPSVTPTVVVRMVPTGKGLGLTDSGMAFAPIGSGMATIAMDRVEQFASLVPAPQYYAVTVVTGLVVAHEIGHAGFGLGHVPHTIMRPYFFGDQVLSLLGVPAWNRQQVRSLRADAQRLLLASASTSSSRVGE